MLIRANDRNLRQHARTILGAEYSRAAYRELRREVLTGFVRDRYVHVSHDRAAHLERIDRIVKGYGVEGLLLNRRGEDVSGTYSMQDVRHDVQYVNLGETYAMTILYYNGRLMIGDWGSIVERCA